MRISGVFQLLFVMGALLITTESLAQPPAPILFVPGYPNASNTGVPAGVTLSPCTGPIVSNQTYDSCLFSNGVDMTGGQTGVTISRSKVLGTVNGYYITSGNVLTMTDVEIDGQNSGMDATNGLDNWTCIRCKVHNVSKCFSGTGFTLQDSYCYDIYGTPASHNETILGSGTAGITVTHNNLVANWNAAGPNGAAGFSSVVSFYADKGGSTGNIWGPLANVLFQNNLLTNTNTNAVYCIYPNSVNNANTNANIRILNNVFVGGPNGSCGNTSSNYHLEIGWASGSTNVWSGNTYDDGTPIPEP